MNVFEYHVKKEIEGPILCNTNFCADDSSGFNSNNPFSSLSVPSLGVQAYMLRIQKYANCSPSALIGAGIYLDRIITLNPDMLISIHSFHRLFLTAVVLAAKYFDDKFFTNRYYSRVGGVKMAELNKLEIEFLFKLKFTLQISTEEFEDYCRMVDEMHYNIHFNPLDDIENPKPILVDS
eukprot:TRINITY_DN222_c0_g1_i1.p1 TRINITY_DN222_c0_g1~~TRINITY_DN222_c0_g1_i1.p1  ORF type:complete len:207 (+),score=44.57 TRINITY_DN222_c0_g1_i1:85-621(+)